ncbi:PTS system glucose-specific IIABC component [Malacoplasma penetrans HF-2]|uniref:PTS system glucose-specific IIABC component n=1 Tax=Malacoplasma penetrans (strain HF-2) TaxID=272633 RepID=Q8EWN0_MALP2|nr:glucose PTS transporter subunit IIA [Malacoplasma penetrans]BAC43964.1 PTS system glucose-specific IIABC component [Malacoplasma penetrans HF-2]
MNIKTWLQKSNSTFFNMFHFKKGETKNKGKVKDFFSQLSRGLMLPIAILPIAGLLLGIGGAIGANIPQTSDLQILANIFKAMSQVVFDSLPILFCVAITITFSKDRGTAAFSSLLAYLVFCSIQVPFIQKENGQIVSIMWFHTNLNVVRSITTTLFGFTNLQTSIFGGILVGFLTSFIYNKVSKIKLPTALDFFSGIRLVPIVLIPVISLLAVLFLIFWPWVGYVISIIGQNIQLAPYGTGGLLYGILGRSLMPFGLHHIPIILAYQTDFGGVLYKQDLLNALVNNGVSTDSTIYQAINNAFPGTSIVGDQNIWNFINSLSFNSLPNADGTQTPIFQWFVKNLNVYAGKYTQDYPTYMGACMGIGVALILVSKKENRKRVASVVGSAMAVAFLTGITEPLEYTFLFCAAPLYYLIYVPLSGISYMLMELSQAHVGVGFARGFIDLIIYGAIPVVKGSNFYWAFPIAIGEGLITGFSFYFLIKKFNFSTPGRNENNFELITKSKYKEMKNMASSSKNKNEAPERIAKLIYALGGLDNIENVTACATRLRVSLNSSELVKVNDFKSMGSKGEFLKDKAIQVIFGGEASILSDQINDVIEGNLSLPKDLKTENTDLNKQENKVENKKIIPFKVFAPVNGKIQYLENVDDDVFKNKLMGNGVAILPTSNKVYSILSKGKLVDIFDTKHCYTFESEDKTKILFHIGIDSVSLSSNPFKPVCKKDSDVSKKSLISEIDLNLLKKAKSIASPIVLPELLENQEVKILVKNNQVIKQGDPILEIIEKTK